MRTVRVAGLLFVLLFLGQLVLFAPAGVAKPQADKVRQVARPISTLAMDGPRVAYIRADRKVVVWNTATGKTMELKGNYPSNGSRFGHGTGEVAIAGKRVALITRFVTGNSYQTQERLYTGPVGGAAHQLGKLTSHFTDPSDCDVQDPGLASGKWIAGVVGSGKTLAVSTWKASKSVSAHERLSVVTPTGLRTIATGPGAVVAQSADGSHIAVLRSTRAWPPTNEVGPAPATPTVGIYSTDGSLLREIELGTTVSGCSFPAPIIHVALSGHELVVLTETIPKAGSLQSTIDVYDWTTGALKHSWPVALGHASPGADGIAVHGHLAAVEGSSSLHLFDLATGKDKVVAPTSGLGCPAAIGARGLVYAVDRRKTGELTFVPTARLLAMAG